MHVSRRGFFKVCAAGMTGSSLATMGFAPTAALAEVRQYKLAHATETRSICPYCSVSCGTLIYSMGDKSKNAKARIFHIEGDPDNPVNRGSLCPKGAGLLDMLQRGSIRLIERIPDDACLRAPLLHLGELGGRHIRRQVDGRLGAGRVCGASDRESMIAARRGHDAVRDFLAWR